MVLAMHAHGYFRLKGSFGIIPCRIRQNTGFAGNRTAFKDLQRYVIRETTGKGGEAEKYAALSFC